VSRGVEASSRSAATKKSLERGLAEWDQLGDHVIVRRTARYDWNDVRKALFPKGSPQSHTLDELKQTRLKYIRRKHARG
jgi:hypothetical protein